MRDDWEIQDEELLEDGETKEDLVQALEEAGHAYVSIDGLSYHIALRGEGLPLICLHGLSLTISDDIQQVGDWNYVKATVTVTDGQDSKSVSAFARAALTLAKAVRKAAR